MYRISTGMLSQVVNLLKAEGLDAIGLCRAAGVDLTRLREDGGFFPRSTYFHLTNLAQQLSDNPDLGLKAYQHFLPGSFQLVGYTMMSSPNLLEAFKALVHYAPLLGSGAALGLQREDNRLRLCAEVLPEPGSAMWCRVAEDIGCSSVLGFSRWLTGGTLPRIREIVFTYPEPEDTILHQALFDCDLIFGADRSSIVFDLAALKAPLGTANEALALLHRQFAEYCVGQLTDATYRQQVHSYLLQHLGSLEICDLDSVAIALRVNKRILQRELSNEGKNFMEVLDEVKRQLTDHYLRTSSYTLNQVGELVGFKESSSFHKACQRWFGMPPGRYRNLTSSYSGATQPPPEDAPMSSILTPAW